MIHVTPTLLGVQKNGKEFLATRIAHFELLQMYSLDNGHRLVAPADEEEALEHGAGLAAGLAPACAIRPACLGAGFALVHPVHRLWRENITEYTPVTDSK